jgi:hypothetical protein
MTARQALTGFALVAALLVGAIMLLDQGDDAGLDAAPVGRTGQPLGLDGTPPSAADLSSAAGEPGDVERLAAQLPEVELPSAGAPGSALSPTGTVRGQLIDLGGRPVPGEPVDLLAGKDPWRGERHPDATQDVVDRGVSDEDGRFVLGARPGSSHQLYAGGRVHPRQRVASVASGDELLIELRDPRVFTGTIVEQETGYPVPGARAGAHSGDDRAFSLADEHGRFRLGPLRDDLVVLTGFARGYDVAITDKLAPDWGDVTIELPPGRRLDGRVVDSDSAEPVSGARVTLRVMTETRPAGEPDPLLGRRVVEDYVAVTADAGRFSLDGLPSRAFRVIVEAEGYRVSTSDRYFGSSPDFDEELVIGIVPARDVGGLVQRDGAPVTGARVSLRTDEVLLAEGVSDEEGRFALPTESWDGLAPISLEATAPGDEGGVTSARQRLGKGGLDEQQVLELVPAFPLLALVQNRAGPLAGAHVLAWSQGALPIIVLADGEGRASLAHRMAGPGVDTIWMQARAGDVLSTAVAVAVEDGPPAEPVILDVDDGAWFEGLVLDVNGIPIPGANVWITGGRFTTTDAEGRFSLGPTRLPEAGSMTVVAWREGYRKGEWKDVLPADDLVLTLDPVVSWHGRALDAATGLPLDSVAARLQTEQPGDGGPRWVDAGVQGRRTGEPGAFRVDLPGPGRHRLQALADGFVTTQSEPVDFDGNTPPSGADLYLGRAAMLEVTVEDDLGQPVRGYLVWLVPWEKAAELQTPAGVSGEGLQRQLTDVSGLTRFNLATGGQLRLASGPGAWIDGGPFTVTPGETARRLVRVPALGGVDLTVRDEDDAPIAGLKLTLRSTGEERVHTIWRQGVLKQAHEVIEARDLPEGEYAVVLEHKQFEGTTRPFTVIGGRTAAEHIVLEPRRPESADG